MVIEGQLGDPIGLEHLDPLGYPLPPLQGSFGARLTNFTVQVRCVSSDGATLRSPKWTINGDVTVKVPVVNQAAVLDPNVIQAVKD